MEGTLRQRDSDPLAGEMKAAALHLGELTMEVKNSAQGEGVGSPKPFWDFISSRFSQKAAFLHKPVVPAF
jgi:hypothetical protein